MTDTVEAVLGAFPSSGWTTVTELMRETGLTESRVRYALMPLVVRGLVEWRTAGRMNQYRRRGEVDGRRADGA